MIEQSDIKKCIGCKACKNVCPKNAIEMIKNIEGFEYPKVKAESCVKCGKCLKVCPSMETYAVPNNEIVKNYAARNKDRNVVLKSSSGGVFNALARKTIELSGVVYGVAFNSDYGVEYVRVTEVKEIEKMQGSKYVDVYISDECINQFINDIKKKKYILFTGTSCQIAGMIRMCKSLSLDMEKVIWVDFYRCSGKVSSLLWNEEVKKLSKNGKIRKVSFRDKTKGWENYSFAVDYQNRKYMIDFLNTNYSKFLGNPLCERISCIECGYECGACGSDISLGDYWYKKDVIPLEWDDNKGISIVQTSTLKGELFFEGVQDFVEYKIIPKGNYVNTHTEILCEEARKEFWKAYVEKGYSQLCEEYANVTIKEKILFGIIRPFLINTKLIDKFRK